MRREGPAPLGEPRTSPSQILPLNAPDCESVRVRSAASLGLEPQAPPALPSSGGSASLQPLASFPPRARAPLALALRQHNSRDQPRPRQHKSQEEGSLLGAWQPLLPASHKAAAANIGAWLSSGMGEVNTQEPQDANGCFHTNLSFSSLSYLPAQSGGL